MKVVSAVCLLVVLIIGIPGSESTAELGEAMPTEPEVELPPGIDDAGDDSSNDADDSSTADKRNQNNLDSIDLKSVKDLLRLLSKSKGILGDNTQKANGYDNTISDTDPENTAVGKRGSKKTGGRRKQNKNSGEIDTERPEREINTSSRSRPEVTSLEQAKELSFRGVETPSLVTEKQQLDTVAIHQHYRNKEHGSNMWAIKWDDSLARLGQALADTCVFKHTNLYFANDTRVGQNLAIVKGGNHSIEFVTELFYREKLNYDMVNHDWVDYNIVGHYLQLVYWDTVKVGCGLRSCPTLYLPDGNKIWTNTWYWACNYWPPLHVNTRPYKPGLPCSDCVVPHGKGIGWKCVKNTCETCRLEESYCNHPGPCLDYEPDTKPATCEKVKRFGYCEENTVGYKYAKVNCRTTCKLCRIPEALTKET